LKVRYCSSCNAPITWVQFPKGPSPVDATPSDQGTVRVVVQEDPDAYPLARPLGSLEALCARADGEQLYLSHFATCPNAAMHRKKKRQEPLF
jgi:hypothetical protein